jgi:hypothetical protein
VVVHKILSAGAKVVAGVGCESRVSVIHRDHPYRESGFVHVAVQPAVTRKDTTQK